jgi:glycosyltransferase involved in cell wall biosynthesis
MAKKQVKITVVVPTYNEEKNIGRCLETLNNQTMPRKDYEIIVVDWGSKDKTRQIAKKLGARVILQKSRGVGGARNDGAFVGRGEIVATTDADTEVPNDWLEKIWNGFQNKSVVGLFGPVYPIEKKGKYQLAFPIGNWLIYLASRTELHHNMCGANMAIRMKEFIQIGGFSDVPNCDDIEIYLRLKKIGRVYFDRRMKMYYSTRRLDKFGLFGMVWIWLTNLRRLLTHKVVVMEDTYARMNY